MVFNWIVTLSASSIITQNTILNATIKIYFTFCIVFHEVTLFTSKITLDLLNMSEKYNI